MKQLKSSAINMVMVLGVFTLLAGLLLGWVNKLTSGPIEEVAARALVDAIGEVTPAFTNNPVDDAMVFVPENSGREVKVYPALNGDRLVGAAVESFSLEGFSGEITVMFGFDVSGTVTGYRVLSHAETPGLGANMDKWFSSPVGHRSVIGLNPERNNISVSKDGGDIDGITAATITSRAFLDALRRAHEAYVMLLNTKKYKV